MKASRRIAQSFTKYIVTAFGQKLPFTTHESVELASNSGRPIIESFTHEKI